MSWHMLSYWIKRQQWEHLEYFDHELIVGVDCVCGNFDLCLKMNAQLLTTKMGFWFSGLAVVCEFRVYKFICIIYIIGAKDM